jgi:hypothetical protein
MQTRPLDPCSMRRASCATGSNFNARVARKGRQYGNLAAVPRNVLAACSGNVAHARQRVPEDRELPLKKNFPDAPAAQMNLRSLIPAQRK